MLRGLKSHVVGFVVIVFLIGNVAVVSADDGSSAEELLARIKALEAQLASQQTQNEELAAQIDSLKSAVAKMDMGEAATPEALKEAIAAAAPVKAGGKEIITIKGFISTTYYFQDPKFAFSNGQNAQWPVGPEHTQNEWFSGGDVRNTRLTIGFSGPELGNGWTSGATVEGDFFSSFNGSGAFSHQQPTPRLRLAFVDLKKGATTFRMGQYWTPLFGEVPASTSHIAFPLGYGSAGMVGWRFPGFFLYHDLSGKDAAVKTKFTAAIFEGSWSGPGTPTDTMGAGNVDFRQQVEARLDFGAKAWKLYLAGHWDDKDLHGVNNADPNPAKEGLTGTAVEIGGSYRAGKFLIHGNIYTSTAAGQQFAAITQFGDISDFGGWLQLGYDFTDRWSLFGFYGMCDPDDEDVLQWVGANGRVKNEQTAIMLRYGISQYQFGVEWLRDTVTTGANEDELDGNQIAVSALYKF